MKKAVSLEFSELHENIEIELDDSQSPRTVRVIIDNLPIKIMINRWGDELYTDETPVTVEEENGKTVVNLLDVAYWPEGSALCFFYSPVNIISRITTKPVDVQKFLESIEKSHIRKKVPVTLR
jgi:hypothetical protein